MYYHRLILIATVLGFAYVLLAASFLVPPFGLALLAAGIIVWLRQPPRYTAHGTARWADWGDVEHLSEGHGIVLGHMSGRVTKWEGVKALFDPGLTAAEAVRKCLASFQRRQEPKLIRLTDAVHTAVFAPSGAGKNVSIVEPFLLSSPENMLVVDVKGENAAITAEARRSMGQKVVLLDPFKIATRTPASFNVLDTIDTDDPESVDMAKAVAEAVVIKQPGDKEPHWNEKAEKFIQGVILAAVNFQPEGERSLQDVAAALANKEYLAQAIDALRGSAKHDGLLARIGDEMSISKDKELDGILSTANRHLGFLSTPAVAASTRSTSGFRLADLDEGFTGFLVLPPHYMRSHAGLMRLWITAFLRARVTKGVGGRPLNVVLDEAATLGRLEAVNDMLTIGRGYSIKLTFVYQSMGQLKTLFPEDQGATLLSNTTQIFFYVSDKDTAEYVSSRLGEATILVSSGGTSEGRNLSTNKEGSTYGWSSNTNSNWNQMARRLLQPSEVTQIDRRAAMTFHPGCPPIATYLVRYYEGNPLPKAPGRLKVLADTGALFLTMSTLAALTTAALIR